MADIIIQKLFNKPVFTWGGVSLIQQSDFRKQYINAVQKADLGNYRPLITFSRA